MQVTRSPGKSAKSIEVVYAGKAKTFPDKGLRVGKRYRYTVSAFDAAGNKASRTITVTATGALLAPAPGERVTTRPRLSWARYAARATTTCSWSAAADPQRLAPDASLTLPRSWVFQGTATAFIAASTAGTSGPASARLAAAHYGGLVGRSSFLFAR